MNCREKNNPLPALSHCPDPPQIWRDVTNF